MSANVVKRKKRHWAEAASCETHQNNQPSKDSAPKDKRNKKNALKQTKPADRTPNTTTPKGWKKSHICTVSAEVRFPQSCDKTALGKLQRELLCIEWHLKKWWMTLRKMKPTGIMTIHFWQPLEKTRIRSSTFQLGKVEDQTIRMTLAV